MSFFARPVIEQLEPRKLFSDATLSALPVVTVTAKGAAAYESGPTTRFFYLRRDTDLDQPLVVFYTVGGKAKQNLDYNAIGNAVTIKAGTYLRRIEITPIDDGIDENNESITLTLNTQQTYSVGAAAAATIRIISNEDTPEPPPPPTPPPPPPPPPSVSTQTTITWQTKLAAPIIRAEALRAVVDGKIYVLGGFSGDDGPVKRSDVYDPVANTWTQIADLPVRLTHAGVAVEGRNIYVAGGYVGKFATGYDQTFGVRNVRKFDIDTQLWTDMPQLPRALAGGGLAIIGRKLYYFGGNDATRADAGDHYVLDLDDTASGWQTLPNLPDPRSHFGYVALDGKIYVIGGQTGNDADLTTLNKVHVYDPGTNLWTELAQLPIAVSHIASAAFVQGGRIIIAGGETAHEAATNRVTSYNPLTNAWTSMTTLPSTRFSGVATAIDDVLYFTGGSSQTTTWRGVLS